MIEMFPHAFAVAALLGASARLASALPSGPAVETVALPSLISGLEDGTFSVKATKFGQAVDGLVSPLTSRDASQLEARGFQFGVNVDSTWWIPVSFGDPHQGFYMLGDSGGNSLSIQSTLEDSASQGSNPPPLYDPTKSSSSKQLQGYSYSECFGSGYCDNGLVYTDTFCVGSVCLTGMPFEVETHNNGKKKRDLEAVEKVAERATSTVQRSGTLGLNFDQNGQSTSPNRLPGWFQSIKGYLNQQVWSINYHKPTSQGTFNFGFIDNTSYTGTLDYSSVVDNSGEWTVSIAGWGAGAPYNSSFSSQFNMLVDTGSGLSNFPKPVLQNYFSQYVQGSTYNSSWGTWSYPCGTTLPDFRFIVNGAPKNIPSSYFQNGAIGGGLCISTLFASGDGNAFLAQNFIEALFIVFDWQGSRVGFANKQT